MSGEEPARFPSNRHAPNFTPMPAFDFQPTLSDNVVRLRPLQADDWEGLYGVARDPAIWALHPATERWTEPSFRAFFQFCLERGGTLVIEDAATDAIIGSSRFDRERAENGEVEIGWTFLARDRWGGVVNRSVKKLMVAHVLATFDRAIFLIGEANVRSRRAIEKIGGVLTPRIVDAPVEGRPTPHVVYAIDQAAFANGPLGMSER